jgi:hypothetical protein
MMKHLLSLLLLLVAMNVDAQGDYIRVKGYYRTYQVTDSALTYCIDGMMEFFFPTDGGDGFAERKILGERRRRMKGTTDRELFARMNIPNLEVVPLIESIDSATYDIWDDGSIYIKDEKAGSISSAKGITTINMDELTGRENHELDMGQLKMYGIVARMTRYDEQECYATRPEGRYDAGDMRSSKKQITYKYTLRGDDRERHTDVVSEFYVTDRVTISHKEMKTVMKQKNSIMDFNVPSSVPRMAENMELQWGNMEEY